MCNTTPAIRPLLAYGSMLLLIVVLALSWQIASPSDIDDNEQPITLSHFMDVAQQGHWLTQINPFEGISTKPPAYHWLGGIGLMVTPSHAEWQLKLSVMLCFVITTGLIIALARSCLDWPAALLATAVWVANFHVIKLAYTARPDMMLTMFMTLSLVAMQYQRKMWHTPSNQSLPLSYWAWLVLLWGSLAMAGLTKGPPALLVAALVAILLWRDRKLFTRHTWPHALGMTLAIGITLLWLKLAMHYYPQWHEVLDKELWSRLAGDAAKAKDYPPRWREIVYFLGRFFPWSLLTIAAMVILPWWRRPSVASQSTPPAAIGDHQRNPPAATIAWAAWWMIVVLVILALPKGRRADHILPVYAGASVLVAALMAWAQAGHRASRVATHLLTGGVLIAGLVAAGGSYFLPRPAAMHWPLALVSVAHVSSYTSFILITASVTAALAGLVGLWQLHTRRYINAGFLACICLVAMVGLYQTTYNRSAKNRNGDYVIAFARTASQIATQEQRTPLFYDTGYVPVQTLMGYHQEMRTYKSVAPPTLLITSVRGWATLTAAGAQGQILLETPRLAESSAELLLVRPTLLPESLPADLIVPKRTSPE